MVMGSSLVGRSGVPGCFIACTSPFPLEVTRKETQPRSGRPDCGGSVVKAPFHVPASVFSLSKDFCASDFFSSGWANACANVRVEAAINNPKLRAIRRDFMFVLLN